jgi:23S rRNA pseudouridine1911/1915/1917 synthase
VSEKFSCKVGGDEAGARLDRFLASRLPSLSRMRIASLVAAGACAVNGAAAHAGFRLRAGDAVEIGFDASASEGATTPEAIPLSIVHEDEDLLVVDKPAGMLVHPTRSVKTGTLANALTHHLNRDSRTFARPGLPHRLDRATSGLMVVAKNQRALTILSRHFHRRLVEKRYLALLHGRVARDELTISAPIGRTEEAWPKWRVTDDGREAVSRLRVLERRGELSLAELEPVTGRTNQLRIHCAHAGHPIVGDDWYGSHVAGRLCLHAARLAFNHPAGGARVEFSSPLPEEVASLLEAAGRDVTE